MKTASPLRYPGGKSAMADLLTQIRHLNEFENYAIGEPFAGGAGASLSLLYSEETHKIHINDLDPAIHDFWWTLKNRPAPFIQLLKRKRASIAEWRRQRETYRNSKASRLSRGFSTFYLNRCNRSGIIINGGPIGGLKQIGKWKINARYNKSELIERCNRVTEHRSRIHVSQEDGIKFISRLKNQNVLFFIDPPYYVKGDTLYLNSLEENYHTKLAQFLKDNPELAWVVTYDDCQEIRDLYKGWATIRPFALNYAAANRRKGAEVLIAPRWLKLPASQKSSAIIW